MKMRMKTLVSIVLMLAFMFTMIEGISSPSSSGTPLGAYAAIAASSVSLDWSATVSTPTSSLYGSMIALDSDDNIFVTGSVPRTTIITAKYNQLGTQLWQREFSNPNTRQEATWIAADPFGNVVVTGYLLSGNNINKVGLVTIKYDGNGNLLWQDVIPSAYGYALRVTTDATGNAYMLGYANTDLFIIKYSPDGTKLWTRFISMDAYSIDNPKAIAIAPNGNIVVTGAAGGWFLTVAYNANGNLLWSKSVQGSTGAQDLAFSPNSEVYVVGGTYTQATSNVFLVIKYDANGNQIWSNMYPGYYAVRAAVNHAGDLIVTGVTANGYMGWLTHKISAAGILQWSQQYHPFGVDEVPYFLTIGPNNEAYITGQGGQVAPDPGGMGYLTPVTIRYSANGAQDWVAVPHMATRALGVRLTSNNKVAVVGQSPFTVFNYVQTIGPVNQPPFAVASANPTSGTGPLIVNFISTGSSDPDGIIVSYSWNFGDGTTSLQANPGAHTYTVPGSYAVSLTVTDNAGSTTSSSVTVTVTPSTAKALRSTTINLSGTRIGNRVTVSSQVGVRDSANVAVSGVNVYVTWSKPDGTTVTQTAKTGSSGTASFSTSSGRGTYRLTVTNLAKTGYTFDPAHSVLSKSITK